MRIAVLASEGAPYAKSGGLGDVMEALPAALRKNQQRLREKCRKRPIGAVGLPARL